MRADASVGPNLFVAMTSEDAFQTRPSRPALPRHIWPADIECEMRHGLGDLALGKPVIHPNRDMARELRNLTACDERADRDEAAVARRKIGAQPQVAKQHFRRVLHNTGEQGTAVG